MAPARTLIQNATIITMEPSGDLPLGDILVTGDTLTEIARTHGVSQEDLRRWNALERDAVLQPGQTLRILPPPS